MPSERAGIGWPLPCLASTNCLASSRSHSASRWSHSSRSRSSPSGGRSDDTGGTISGQTGHANSALSAHPGDQLRGEPLLGEDAVFLEVVANEGEPLAFALLPSDEDARVRTWRVSWAADPDVATAGGHGRDGVLVSPS